MSADWTPADVPDLTGRRVLVTGAGHGVARETAIALAEHGATLVLADPDLAALTDVVRRADAAAPVRPVAVTLDLVDPDSVADAAEQVRETVGDGPLDLVVLHHEGGDGEPLTARVTGPFSLLARLHDLLTCVVTVVPPTHRLARDLSEALGPGPRGHDEPDHGPGGLLRRTAWGGAAEASLASLLLALELDSRARATGTRVRSLVAVAGLDVQDAVDRVADRTASLRERRPGILDAALGAVGQRADVAHHPVLMAATASLPGSSVVGLSGALGLGTRARLVNPPRAARDSAVRARVWELAVATAGEDPWG